MDVLKLYRITGYFYMYLHICYISITKYKHISQESRVKRRKSNIIVTHVILFQHSISLSL